MLTQDDRLYFIHIPKTAGTTLTPLVDMHFGVDEICPAQLWRQLVRIPQKELPTYRLFRGHFGGNGLNAFLPEPPVCMTMLRKPQPLTISTFKFIQREAGTRVHDLVRRNNMSLEDFIDHLETKNKVSDKQVRHLSFDLEHDPDSGPIFLHHESLAVVDKWIKDHRIRVSADERLERAKAKLEECAFVGLVERFEESMALMCYTFGWPPTGSVQKLMVAPKDKKSDSNELSDEIAEKISSINQLDEELYRFAEILFDKQYSAMQADLKRYAISNMSSNLEDTKDLYPLLDAHYCNNRQKQPKQDRIRVTFDEPLYGDGWHRREDSSLDGSTFRWTGPNKVSTLDLNLDKTKDMRITICIINSITDEIRDSLKLRVDGTPVKLKQIQSKWKGIVFQGAIPVDALDGSIDFIRLQFEVDNTVSPNELDNSNNDSRAIGIAINWMDIAPADVLEEGCMPEIIVDEAERLARKVKLKRAIVSQLKQRVTSIPVVGPRIRDMYIKMKTR